jgi:YD repeat-containing protein
MRACWQRSCLWVAALFVLAGSCHAQSTSATPDQEYQKLIQVDQNIEPLGEHPFGENISTYDGSLSFNVTDITLRGNGPTITVGRTAQWYEWVPQTSAGPQLPFGSWELDIPRIETLVGTAGIASSAIWQTAVPGATTTGTTQRCSTFTEPPGIAATLSSGGWVPDEWWYGYNLLVPGEGKQVLMPRYSANTLSPTISGMSFSIVTKNNWMISCGVTASDGGEGFFAIAPDGTRYTFAHLVYRPYFPIVGAGGALLPDGTNIATSSTPSTQSASTTQGATPMVAAPGGVSTLERQDALMYVTQIQDRFGNTLTYNYDPNTGYLTSITASDGREVDVTYVSGTPYIQTITAKATNVPSRTWTYSYDSTAATIPNLTGVQLPDGSAWSYQLPIGPEDLYFRNSNCSLNVMPQVGDFSTPTATGVLSGTTTGTITAPSGLTGTFGVALKLSGRSYTPQWCYGSDNGTMPMSLYPEWYVQPAIVSEALSGPGMPTQTWSYSYSSANPSWSTDACATSGTCATTVYTDVTDPNGNDSVYTYSNRFDATEGLLLRTDSYSGSSTSGTLVRSEVNTYANASNGPWPSVYGIDLAYRDNYFQTEQLSPLSQRQLIDVFASGSDTYTWNVKSFDSYAHPTDVVRSNSISGQQAIEETTTFLNDPNLWVLGLTQTVVNNTTGEMELSDTYNSSDLLQSRSRFGEFMMSYTWNSAGQLASFTDGNNNTTSLSNYYRGIPQSISYPDSTSQTLTVDDLSEISSITDQAGYTTQYTYDAIGRISQVTYPTNDPNGVTWYTKTFTYTPPSATPAERGIAAGHWDRTVTIGNAVTTTYFDADLRPVLSDTSNGNQDITTATAYDYTGATTFASYPVYGQAALTSVTTGTHHTYDALERLTQTQEDSELGTLTTTTAYNPGASEQVTDPNGNVTTTYYQVFDEPSYKDPIQVNAPAGISQAIVRDIYGNPTSITQSGLYGSENDSVTKTLLYDSYHRLCRTTEPESGSTVMAYDAANNLAWSAQGQTITDGTCGQSDVATAAQTVRTYDAMNRVLTISPPSGTQATTYTYDARGNVKTTVSGIAIQGFTYNSRNLLTNQVLWIPSAGYSWGVAYNYDGYAHVSTIGYPSYNGTSEGVAYSPDAFGRATQVGNYASGITYFPNDQVEGFNYGNGASYVAEQNTRQLLSNFSYGLGSTLNISEDYTYDNNGNITNVNDLVNGQRTKGFTYDALNRLTNAQANNLYGTETYTYDALNNLRTRLTGGNTLTLNYNAANQLASVDQNGSLTTSYGYDNQGNRNSLSSGGATTSYSFDAENQLLQVSGVEGYAYDAAGRRIAKTATNGTASEYYFYDQAGQLIYSFTPATAIGTNYIYLGTKLIAKHALQELTVPTSVNVSANPNNGNFTVSWGASAAATSYTLQESINGGAWNTIYSGSATSASLTGRAGGTYTYQVQACASGGCSGWAASSSVGVWPAIPMVGVPSGTMNGTYSVTWSASPSATGYTVQEALNGGAWTTIASNTTATSISRPGNANGSYTYQVESLNSYGTAGWSATSAAVVVNTTFGVMPTPTPTLTVPATNNTGSPTISWSAASPVTGYTLQQSANGGTSWTMVYSGTGTSVTLTGLAAGSYTYQLQACNTAGGGSACTAWINGGTLVVTLPPTGTPSLSTPSLSSNGSYTVSWSTVATATSYTLQQQVNGGSWTTIQSSSATSWAASGEGDGTYAYRVQACNVGGCGPWSATGTTTVTLPPSSAPTLTVPATSGSGAYSVTWTAVSTATSYTVQQQINGGAWTTVQSSASTSLAISGEGNGTYAYQVQACNAGGCGPWSSTGTVVVTLPPATAPTLTINQPSLYSDTVDFSWTSVATATAYQLEVSTDQTTWTQIVDLDELSTTYAPGTGTFYFEIRACNAGGCGPWSPIQSKAVVDK